jgi:type III secretion protein Q
VLTSTAVIELSEASAFSRLPLPACKALNRLYDGRAPIIEFMLCGVSHQLQWRFANELPADELASYRFRLGPHTGWVALDAFAQAALLQEPRHALLPPELRYVLLADALQPVAAALESALRLHFEWSPGEPDEIETPAGPDAAACFVVNRAGEAGAWQGFVQFLDPAALDKVVPALTASARGHAGDAFDGLRVPLAFAIGDSVLSLGEVRGIRPGDIVSVEHWTAAGAGLVVRAAMGGGAGRELIARAEGSRITVTQWRTPSMKQDDPVTPAGEGDHVTGLPLDRLDALEVALRFEVGHLTLSLGELRNIRPGHVFDLAQPLNRCPVRILAHGNALGKGFLVAVGERLGVRISEFAPGELKS